MADPLASFQAEPVADPLDPRLKWHRVLADAVGSAGRAATNRTGTLPVLAGVRLQFDDDSLSLTGTDAADFVIVGNELHLAAGTSLNFEAKASYDEIGRASCRERV